MILLALALLAFVLVLIKNSLSPSVTTDYDQQRLLRFSYEVSNETSSSIKSAKFSSYLPAASMPSQLTQDIQTSTPYQLSEGEHGNLVAHFDLGFMPPYGKKVVNFTATIKTAKQPNYLDDFDKQVYLKSEQYIEKESVQIIELAESLKGKTESETVNNIYSWVAKNINYAGYVSADKGALKALQEMSGCLLYTSPSPRDLSTSRMPSSA